MNQCSISWVVDIEGMEGGMEGGMEKVVLYVIAGIGGSRVYTRRELY